MALHALRTFSLDWSNATATLRHGQWERGQNGVERFASKTATTQDVYVLGDAVFARLFPALRSSWKEIDTDFSNPSAAPYTDDADANKQMRFSPIARFGVTVDFEAVAADVPELQMTGLTTAGASKDEPRSGAGALEIFHTLLAVVAQGEDMAPEPTFADYTSWQLVSGPARFSVHVANGYSKELHGQQSMLDLEFVDLGEIARKLFDSLRVLTGADSDSVVDSRALAALDKQLIRYNFPKIPANPTMATFQVWWNRRHNRLHFRLLSVVFMLSDATCARLMPDKALFRVEALL